MIVTSPFESGPYLRNSSSRGARYGWISFGFPGIRAAMVTCSGENQRSGSRLRLIRNTGQKESGPEKNGCQQVSSDWDSRQRKATSKVQGEIHTLGPFALHHSDYLF